MASHRFRWRCGLTLAMWLLATAAAIEDYEVVDLDTRSYQDESNLEAGALRSRDLGPMEFRTKPDLALAKDMLLYKLIRSLRIAEEPRTRYRPSWSSGYEQPRHHQDATEKDGMVKRLTDAIRTTGTDRNFKSLDSIYRPQQKWKIKKGSQMVCYFKLCAFRSPV